MKPRTALASGVILLLVGALAGYLYGVDSAPEPRQRSCPRSPSRRPPALHQVADSFANHMLFLSERNATAIANQYAGNATVTWNGAGNNGVGGLAAITMRQKSCF